MTENSLHFLSLASALLYCAAFGLLFLHKKASFAVWICGCAANGIIIASNFAANGYVPFVSMYQVLTFLAFTFALVYCYVSRVYDGGFMKGYFIIMQAIVMSGVAFMEQNAKWAFPPALRSAYFIPHVLSYMISYTLVAVAALVCTVNLFKKSAIYAKGVYSLVRTAFPFMLLGMFLGALWANACWGNYWSWDLKEAWSLVTLLSLCIYLHFRRSRALSKHAEIFVIIALVFELITLLFVGMFDANSIHSYS